MGIEIAKHDKMSMLPTIICDECRKQIKGPGSIHWDTDVKEPEIFYTHRKCGPKFKKRVGATEWWWTESLGVYFLALVENSNIDLELAREANKTIATLVELAQMFGLDVEAGL